MPQGVEQKGNETAIALISLCTAIVSMGSTILTFILKIIEVKSGKQGTKMSKWISYEILY